MTEFNIGFVLHASLFKQIARTQFKIDKKFAKDLFALKRKLFTKKISSEEFWKEYKKILLESLARNKKIVASLLKKIDKPMIERYKIAEEEEKIKEERPLIDLSLPK